jgi:hypothetical protein
VELVGVVDVVVVADVVVVVVEWGDVEVVVVFVEVVGAAWPPVVVDVVAGLVRGLGVVEPPKNVVCWPLPVIERPASASETV